MAYNANQQVENINNTAFNTDAILALLNAGAIGTALAAIVAMMQGQTGMLPHTDYDFVEYLPAAQPLTINYRMGGPAGAIVRQLTLTYDGAGNVATMTRVI